MSGWIGVDFDGTLSKYSRGDFPAVGEPIAPMVERVKLWLSKGITVKIFTARVSDPIWRDFQIKAVQDWCVKHIGRALEVTNIKDLDMIELWDDRAVQVEHNTGKLIGYSTIGKD